MKSVVSERGQTVIPKEIREALGLKPGTKLNWAVRNKTILVFPVPDDPITALMGILKDSPYTFEDYLRERNEERKRERIQDEKEERRWRGMSSTPQP